MITARSASTLDQPASLRTCTAPPAARAPSAPASWPQRLYQAKTEVRRASGVVCANEDCSTARNGPTSLPDGLITPNVAATSRIQNTSLVANTRPAAAIRPPPTMSTRLRPIRSACVVSHKDTTVSPSKVSARSRPICVPSNPRAAK